MGEAMGQCVKGCLRRRGMAGKGVKFFFVGMLGKAWIPDFAGMTWVVRGGVSVIAAGGLRFGAGGGRG